MRNYTFRITYTDGFNVERTVIAHDEIKAWASFTEWVKGFIQYGDETLSSIELVSIEEREENIFEMAVWLHENTSIYGLREPLEIMACYSHEDIAKTYREMKEEA